MRSAGVTRDLGVRAAPNYAGVDLGRDAAGRLVAVFSRCGRKRYSCDLFLYRFGSDRATRLRTLSKRRCDEFGPAIDRGVISFGRGPRGRGKRAVCAGGVYAKGRSRRSRVRHVARPVPSATDVARGQVAFTYAFENEDGLSEEGIGLVNLGRKRPKWRRALAGIHGLTDTGSCVTADEFAPVLDGRDLYWEERCESVPGPIGRLRLGERNARYLDEGTDQRVFTITGGTLFVSDAESTFEQTGVIRRIDRPAFR